MVTDHPLAAILRLIRDRPIGQQRISLPRPYDPKL